uniref:Light-independent protochlorophyllide reductase subunit B n=1 Tax=Pectinodesmus pectinatus TaxID=91197 RepID=A0A2H4FP51_9CHLO|nr:photochlorophyllide reductase subunit B [Pectinodesmus pectinatus]AOS53070.1 photochlorophyllide reductase subunit B [Pectinodesmus pectinatus]
MKLAYWMYAGPAHLGTLRVASSFKNVHAIMHAPLGDDYFNVMRSMLERERDFTPVTASIVDRHVLARGSQEKVVENITRKDKEERPDLILLTPTCTSSILQEDLQNFVNRALTLKDSQADVLLADVNHYRVNEFQAADRTLEQIVRFYIEKAKKENFCFSKTSKISANILGVFTLGFHNMHDCRELKRLLTDLGIEINEIIPEGGNVTNLRNLPKAHFNIVPYREVGLMTAMYLKNEFQMPYISTTPMGILNTALFIQEIETLLKNKRVDESFSKSIEEQKSIDFSIEASKLLEKDFQKYIYEQTRFVSQAAWFSRSIDCQNLTGKRAVVFGDATHAASITKILACEMGIKIVCSGTYCKHDADWFREQVTGFCDEILITEDHTQVGDMIARLEPAAIFGTQMERHVGKRLDIPCGVISAPVHIQNFPLGYRPFLGYEGTNQIADLVYNSFTLGMEDHLLEIFNGHDTKEIVSKSSNDGSLEWSPEALQELSRIPGFVRGKVKRNVEKFAHQNKKSFITLELMFAAKESVNA